MDQILRVCRGFGEMMPTPNVDVALLYALYLILSLGLALIKHQQRVKKEEVILAFAETYVCFCIYRRGIIICRAAI